VISPWLDAPKQGMPFGTAMGTGDGVQVEVLVQGAEDAVRLSGAGWIAGMTCSGPVNGFLQCGALP
jgi:hypothetical protein